MTTADYITIGAVIFALFSVGAAIHYRTVEELRILSLEVKWQRLQIDILRQAVIRKRAEKKKTIEEELKEFFCNLESDNNEAES